VSLGLLAAFVAATAALMLIPGPNVALIVANSLRYGAGGGLITVAGTSAAMALQLAVASLGAALAGRATA
jgi:threonine/homoserine/homoserine lactone efflux protein